MSTLRYGLRTYLRAPVFTLSAAVVLALGIGATTAIFALVQSLLLRPLPYPESDRLVWAWSLSQRSGFGFNDFRGNEFLELRERNRSFAKSAGFVRTSWNVTGTGQPQRLSGVMVTDDFFQTLGVMPMLGRPFQPADHVAGRDKVVVFSHAFWRQRFGSDPGVIGRLVMLDGVPYEIVGIMPPDFPLAVEYDMWTPLPGDSLYLRGRTYRTLRVFGRLKPGLKLAQAQAEMSAWAADLARRIPENRGYTMQLVRFDDQEVGGVRSTLWIFAAAVGCVLLIACSNVASLLLARGASRTREMAVRAAVGASRWALIRQMLAESTLLSLAGGVLGFPLAVEGVRLLVALDADALPRSHEIAADGGVLVFAFLLSLATGLVFGLVPALRGSRVSLRDALKEGGRSGTAGRQSNRFRSALVVIEVALGVVLTAGAGLLARSLRALGDVHAGYDVRNVLTMQIALTNTRYSDPAECIRFFERLITQTGELPGVEAAGSTNYLPLSTDRNMVGVWLDSQPVHNQETRISLDNRVITPGYFRSMRVPLIAGRFFRWTDGPDKPKVVIVNAAFARQFFPKGGAVGQRLHLDVGMPWVGEIVGVVGNFRERDLAEEPRLELFTVLTQTTIAGQTLTARTTGDPAGLIGSIRGIIASIDPDVPIYGVRTMQEQVDRSLAQPRLRGALLAVFSVVALVLASLGIYGVIACAVAERRQEIGIRMALGARQDEVRRMIVAQGLKLTLAGLGIGLIGALAASRLLRGFLFGIGPADPFTFTATAVVFLVVAFAASYLPARRATRLDPLEVLREE